MAASITTEPLVPETGARNALDLVVTLHSEVMYLKLDIFINMHVSSLSPGLHKRRSCDAVKLEMQGSLLGVHKEHVLKDYQIIKIILKRYRQSRGQSTRYGTVVFRASVTVRFVDDPELRSTISE
eukprot:7946046-Pyramimonas_sp.AAC.1